MGKRGVVASLVVAVALAGFVVPGVLPATEDDVRSAVASGGRDAGSAVRTARLTATALLDGRVLAPYRSAVFDDARERAADAVDELFAVEVPTDGAARLRDRAMPLLTEAVVAITDTARAAEDDDRAALTANASRLDRLAAGLRELVGAVA
ncbi:hypothetical protein V5P93_004196 [Actinokineospora auranticolor]|uniref:Uncharacterized protein n=1 Tax=Actinokineospora auranticolor TaxID=155976 RepID=A0A2S6GIL5_9PSEU|nr:hypothetical protein [Actinokineospora auranticolor]PPK65059.1 hypothetical protein CLV40_116102 [Actinokineospora auranticolor]